MNTFSLYHKRQIDEQHLLLNYLPPHKTDGKRREASGEDDAALSSVEIGRNGLTPSENVDVLPDMTYELRHFVHLIENNSLQLSERERMHTIQTLAVLDGIRQCCDIKF